MSGAHRIWTPEQRVAAAERFRIRNRDPEFASKRNGAWSAARRAAAAGRLRLRNSDPELKAKRIAWMYDPERKAELRQRGKKTAAILANDIVVSSAHLAGCYRAANRPEKRKLSRKVMKRLMACPQMRIQASINGKSIDHSANAKKGWLTRRRNKIIAAMQARKSMMPTVRT